MPRAEHDPIVPRHARLQQQLHRVCVTTTVASAAALAFVVTAATAATAAAAIKVAADGV